MSRKLKIILAVGNLIFPAWMITEALLSVITGRPNPFHDFAFDSLLTLRLAVVIGLPISAFFILRGNLGFSVLVLLIIMGFNVDYQLDVNAKISEAVRLTEPAIIGTTGSITYNFPNFFLESYDRVALAYAWWISLAHISLILYSWFPKRKRLL